MRKAMDLDAGNNGAVPFSHRQAATTLQSGWRRGSNALAELQHYVFIKLRNAGEIGPDIRLACEWQLTAFECGGQPASKDFMRWDGTVFEPPFRSYVGRPKKELPIVTLKTPRRHVEDARPSDSDSRTLKRGKTVVTLKTLRAGERRHVEDTSTDTTQGGPLKGAPASSEFDQQSREKSASDKIGGSANTTSTNCNQGQDNAKRLRNG
jgi:hypothetical protein